jgi:hypothetical protein
MSRTGVEAKPPWRAVPVAVRRAVAEVARGARVWGGYGPAPTFRLRLADGRGLFFKGVHGASNEFARRALEAETRVYQELGALISPWAPRLYGAIEVNDWRALLLEDLGPKSAPPWTPALARTAARDFAAFHASTLGSDLPGWLDRFSDDAAGVTWERVAEETDGLSAVAALAGGQMEAEARAWLLAALPSLARAAQDVSAIPGPYALIHGDVRSDNLRVVNGRLRLFDWPFAEMGFPEFDLAGFAQSVTVDGGPEPERVVAWYAERLDVRAEALDAGAAWLAAFFAHFAWQPEVAELPRLRRFQRQQLAVTLRWAARRLALPAPDWAAELD